MQMVDLDNIVVAEDRKTPTDTESEVFISAARTHAVKAEVPSEYERLMMAKRRKRELEERRNKMVCELHKAQLQTKSLLRQGYFRKLKLQKKQQAFRFKQERRTELEHNHKAQEEQLFQKTMQIRNFKDRAEQLGAELEQSRRERMNFLRSTFYQDKEQTRKEREERIHSDYQARRQLFTQEKARETSSAQRRQAYRDIREGINKQNYVLRIKRELEELAGYSTMLDELGGVQRQAYKCMRESSQLSKRTQSELRQAVIRDQTFLTDR